MPTLCFTGMDRSEEGRLKALFADANQRLGGHWVLVPEAQAQVLVVDLDSIYGHMTWLKVRNSGKHVIAITAHTESDAEHVMARPATIESMVAALSEVAGKTAPAQPRLSAAQAMASARDAGAQAQQKDAQSPRARDTQELPVVVPPGAAQQQPPAARPDAPQRPPTMREEILAKAAPPPRVQEQPPVASPGTPQKAQERAPQPQSPPVARPVAQSLPPTGSGDARPLPTPTPSRSQATHQHSPRPAAPTRQRDPSLWDYLAPGALPNPSRLDIPGLPPLAINPQSDTYFGTQALKPYIPYCQLGSVRPSDWKPVAGDEFVILKAAYGEAQQLSRLRWLYTLVQGKGELAPGYDPNNKFRLTRWPKTEREFPRHLRIATTMMQGPGTPAEIAAKSDTPLADVNDFINASLESGFAELHNGPATGGTDSAPKTGGFLGRLRGK